MFSDIFYFSTPFAIFIVGGSGFSLIYISDAERIYIYIYIFSNIRVSFLLREIIRTTFDTGRGHY